MTLAVNQLKAAGDQIGGQSSGDKHDKALRSESEKLGLFVSNNVRDHLSLIRQKRYNEATNFFDCRLDIFGPGKYSNDALMGTKCVVVFFA